MRPSFSLRRHFQAVLKHASDRNNSPDIRRINPSTGKNQQPLIVRFVLKWNRDSRPIRRLVQFRDTPCITIKDFLEKTNRKTFKLVPAKFVLNRPAGPAINDADPLHRKLGSDVRQSRRNEFTQRVTG